MLPFLSIFVDIPLRSRGYLISFASYLNPRRWPILDGPEGVVHWIGNFVPFKRERHRSQTETDKNSWNSSETRKARFTAPASFALCLEICSPSHFYQRQRRISACNGQGHTHTDNVYCNRQTHIIAQTHRHTHTDTDNVFFKPLAHIKWRKKLKHWYT